MNKPNQEIQMVPAIPLKPSQQEGSGANGLPLNGTFNLWQMLMSIFKYEKNNLDNNATLQQDWAKNLGGKDGFFSKLYNVGIEVGQKEAQGMMADAYAKFADAGIAFGQLGLTGIHYGLTTRPQLNAANEGIAKVSGIETQINSGQPAMQLREANAVVDSAVQDRINAWADGSDTGPEVGYEELNTKAAQHLAAHPDQLKAVRESLAKRKESLQAQIHNADTNFNSRTQLYNTAGQGAQNAANAGGSMGQAAAANAKAQASASNTIQQQVVQSMEEQQKKSAQNAESALQSANQWAISFAQAAASQVHG
jgi:hypothetical protein